MYEQEQIGFKNDRSITMKRKTILSCLLLHISVPISVKASIKVYMKRFRMTEKPSSEQPVLSYKIGLVSGSKHCLFLFMII